MNILNHSPAQADHPSVCCYNTEMAHTSHHWRYNLNETVLLWLSAHGHLSPEKIVARESMRQAKRQKEANKLVDTMESTGEMKSLYRQFKENLQAARDAKVSKTVKMMWSC